MTKDEALKLALEALKCMKGYGDVFLHRRHEQNPYDQVCEAITAIKEALAQPAQEPAAWMWDVNNGAGYSSRGVGLHKTDIPFAKHTPLYIAPPQRERVVFPTMLRKMWSGGEVQAWLDENVNKEKNT